MRAFWLWSRRRIGAVFDQKRAVGALVVAVVGGLIVGFVLRATDGDDDSDRRDEGAGPPVTQSTGETEFPLPRSDVTAPVDMNVFGRIVTGPNKTEDSSEVVGVQHGNVIQVGTVVQNPSDDASRVLTNLKLEFSLPAGFGKTASINASVSADNAVKTGNYRHADTVVLESADGHRFRSGVPRTFVYQENVSGSYDRFEWGRYRYLPKRAVSTRVEAGEHRVTVRPLSDGTLGPKPEEIFRVFFLADIAGSTE